MRPISPLLCAFVCYVGHSISYNACHAVAGARGHALKYMTVFVRGGGTCQIQMYARIHCIQPCMQPRLTYTYHTSAYVCHIRMPSLGYHLLPDSPSGKLVQIEYALNAVASGSTSALRSALPLGSRRRMGRSRGPAPDCGAGAIRCTCFTPLTVKILGAWARRETVPRVGRSRRACCNH